MVADNKIIADRTIALAKVAMADSLSVSSTFSRMPEEMGRWRPGEPAFMRVRKPLSARSYSLYNDRAQPLIADPLEETVVQLDVDKDLMYSALEMRHEVLDFDFKGAYGEFIVAQIEALSNDFDYRALKRLVNAPYEYVKHVDYSPQKVKEASEMGQDFLLNQLIDARSALKRMLSPLGNIATYAIAGANWASVLRKNQRLVLAQGDNSDSAFARATLGTYSGITIVEDLNIHPDEMYVYTGEAFLQWSMAPSIPSGAPVARHLNDGNVSMLWIQDYYTGYTVDRSVFQSYVAFGHTKDLISARDENGQMVTSEDQYFIRGAKLVLGAGKDIVPGSGTGDTPGASPDSFLAKVYNNQPIVAADRGGRFMDTTYQNIVDGKVAKGKPGDLSTVDGIRTTRKRSAKEVNTGKSDADTGKPDAGNN